MGLENVNWLGTLLAAVAGMVVGAVWYAPPVFGNRWQALIGKSSDELHSPAVAMGIAFVMYLLMGAGLSWIIPDGASLGIGLMWGFIGFWALAMPAVVVNAVFEARPWSLVGLYVGNLLLAILAMSAVITLVGG